MPNIHLTAREIEVLSIAAKGAKAWEIADQLFISKRTVECHFRTAYERLGVNTRMKAVNRARELGFI